MIEKEKHEFVKELSRKVKQIPILLVIGSTEQIYTSYGEPVDPENEDLTTGNNRTYKALCPFHNDDHIGSFVITPGKNMWWCFVEGIGSSTIDFEMKKYGLGYTDAVLHLAKRFSLLTEEEEKKYAGSIRVHDVHAPVKFTEKKKVEQKKADPVFADMVYRLFPLTFPLTEKHRAHLLNVRSVPETSLTDYFSYPQASTDAARELYLKAAEIVAERMFKKPLGDLDTQEKMKVEEHPFLCKMRTDLIHVPGFYKENGKVKLMNCNGIGFLVKGDRVYAGPGGKTKRLVKGINVRRDAVEKDGKRYVWVSSAFAVGKYGCDGGSSPGAPGGIIYPPDPARKKNLIITEGRFKAEAAAKKGNIVIYVSGVSNWKSVIDMVVRTKETYGITAVFAMFDSDLMGNTAVHGQLISMCDAIREKTRLSPRLLLWKIRYGKGFDDLIEKTGNAYTKYMYSIEYRKFEGIYRKALDKALKTVKAKDVRSVPKNKSARFRQLLQSSVESAVEEESRSSGICLKR